MNGPPFGYVSRAGRAAWWFGMPVLLTGWFLFAAGRVDLLRGDAFSRLASAVWSRSHVAAELLTGYPLWLGAMLLLIGVTVWSHYRGVRRVRAESLAIPTFIAGLEACVRLYWFLACGGGVPVSGPVLHEALHLAASASLLAMASPFMAGAMLRAWWPGALSGGFSRRSALSAVAATASVALIWFLYDWMLTEWGAMS